MEKEKIVIVGAGLVGSLLASVLAKRGFEVEVYERRPDIRKAELIAGRSINLALSDRGWKALKLIGIEDEIKSISIPMYGRKMHDLEGNLSYQPYGVDNQAIYSVSRGDLNLRLINFAEKNFGVKFFFDMKCTDINLKENIAHFTHQKTKEKSKVNDSRIFGTDGAFSAVRSRLQKTDRFNYSQFYLEHGYKELVIPANEGGSHKIDKNALHIWPRGNFMLIALANLDGSFTVTLFFPFEGKTSFNSIKTKEDVLAFFKETFPDAVPIMTNLTDDYFENPTSSLVTVKCSPWNYEDKVLVIGDAAHAIVPFYGQGMNSGFEDVFLLDKMIGDLNNDWSKIIPEFAKSRKPDGDAIADLAIQNFIEMRDLVADPMFLLRKKIEKKFYTKYPEKWIPLYSQVTFTDIPYSLALANGKKQEKIMNEIMTLPNIETIWDSDEVEQKILSLV